MKFLLLAGQHVGPDHSQEPRTIKDRHDNEVEVYPDKVYEHGETVDSGDVDLAAKFGANKFQLIDGTKSKKARRTERSSITERTTPHGQVEQGHQATRSGVPGSISEEDLDELGHEHSQPTDGSEVGDAAFRPAETGVSADEEESEDSEEGAKSSEKGGKSLKERYALDRMSKQELIELAEAEEVDLGKAETKEQILQKLKKH